MADTTATRRRSRLQDRVYRIIFESDTPAGRGFDILLILSIVGSVVAVMLDSVPRIRAAAGGLLSTAEWAFTILFTVEYVLRLYSAPRRLRYARSFFGVIDLLALAPTYLSVLLPGGHYLLVVRVLRVLRVFRVLKLAKYVAEAELIVAALKASGRKIAVFLFAVLSIVIVVGSLIDLDRRRGLGLHQHPAVHVLGDRHADHGRLRRPLARNSLGPGPGGGHHDPGLRADRRAHRAGQHGGLAGAEPPPEAALPRVRHLGERSRRPVLPALLGGPGLSARERMGSPDHRPLAGIVVVDMTRVLAGPFANMVLRDLGADIVKVEPPAGDDARGFGPFLPGGASSYFVSLNCGKRSIALDLKNPAGREVFADLLRAADVLIESFRPGVLSRLGFDDERIRALNERLVYVTCSGFGYTGPDAGKPAYDMIIQGRSGLLSITGTESGETVRVGTSIADIVSGLYAVIGVLAGLLRRERGPERASGARVDIAMLDSVVSVLENAVARYQATGVEPGPLGSRHPSITPFETFRTADGQIVIAAGNDRLFGRLCEVLEVPELASDPRFAVNAARTDNRDALKAALEAALARRGTAEWTAALEAAGVPVSPVAGVADVFADPQVAARTMLVEAAGTDGFRVTGSPIKMAGVDDPAVKPGAPALGEHREEILRELLAYSPERIGDLEAAGAFGDPGSSA